jgi:hypothetical protein
LALCTTAVSVLSSCSAIVDLPADCTDDACAPYVCASDAIACLTECATDSECAGGYSCSDAGVCEATGCSVRVDTTLLGGFPSTVSEITATYGSDPEQIVVVFSNRRGLAFRRIKMNGELVPDPIDDASLGGVTLELDNPDRRRFFPDAIFVPGVDDQAPRFLFAWVDVSGQLDEIKLGTFVSDPPSPPEQVSIARGSTGSEFATTSLVERNGAVTLAWERRVQASITLLATSVDLEGQSLRESTATLAQPLDGISLPTMAAVGDTRLVVHSASASGRRTVGAIALDSTAEAIGDVELANDTAANLQVSDLAAEAVADGSSIFAWAQNVRGTNELRFGQIAASRESEIPDNVVSIGSQRIDEGFESIDLIDVTTRESEAGVGFRALRDGVEGAWLLRRALGSGDALGAPLRLVPADSGTVSDFDVVGTPDGYIVLWTQRSDDGATDEVYFRRFACE